MITRNKESGFVPVPIIIAMCIFSALTAAWLLNKGELVAVGVGFGIFLVCGPYVIKYIKKWKRALKENE